MIRAVSLAFAQLFSGAILAVLGVCTLLSIACFVGAWYAIDFAIEYSGVLENTVGDWSTWISGAATIVLACLLFPLVASAFVGLFLERVATIVERQHYPHLPAAKGLPIMSGLLASVRFLAVLIVANLLLLVLLLFPPAYLVGWWLVNGWLLGREYFELIAMRRLSRSDADFLRKRRAMPIFITGLMLTLLIVIPPLALILPIFATAVMTHRFHELMGTEAA
jgi:CysZ protein